MGSPHPKEELITLLDRKAPGLSKMSKEAIKIGIVVDNIARTSNGRSTLLKVVQYSTRALMSSGMVTPYSTPETYLLLLSASKDISTARKFFNALSWISSAKDLAEYYKKTGDKHQGAPGDAEAVDLVKLADVHVSFANDVISDLTLVNKYTNILSPKITYRLDSVSTMLSLIHSFTSLLLTERELDDIAFRCELAKVHLSPRGKSEASNSSIPKNVNGSECSKEIERMKIKRIKLAADMAGNLLMLYNKDDSLLYVLVSLGASLASSYDHWLRNNTL